jgi:hypothetical protein
VKDLRMAYQDASSKGQLDRAKQLTDHINKFVQENVKEKKEQAKESEKFLREKLKGYQEQYYRALEKGN